MQKFARHLGRNDGWKFDLKENGLALCGAFFFWRGGGMMK